MVSEKNLDTLLMLQPRAASISPMPRSIYIHAMLIAALLTIPNGAATEPVNDIRQLEPALDNNWESTMHTLSKNRIRITSRKHVAGDIEEINTPGKSTNKAFQSIQQATLLRAALECKHFGFDYFTITSTRNITTQRDRNRVSGNVSEGDFVMAPGQYTAEIDLGIQVSAKLFRGQFPESRPSDTYAADELLIAFGLSEPTIQPKAIENR